MGLLDKVLGKVFGKKYDKDVKKIAPYVGKINEYFATLSNISNDELRGHTETFRAQIAEGLKPIDDRIAEIKSDIKAQPDMDMDVKEGLYDEVDKLKKKRDEDLEKILLNLLPQAFAVVKETARRFKDNTQLQATATDLDRDLSVELDHINMQGDQVVYNNSWMAAGNMITWDMVHYDVQLIGGFVLHEGKIAEMATGEGKTLVATLPAYLNGLCGLGVHIVTVNNYLAKRDSEWMSGIFNFLGLTIACIDNYQPNSPERYAAYRKDIIYGTNNEFGFDYLRDNMARSSEDQVQHKHHFAMIDEVDSVLIDDARTPLIISGQVDKGDEQQFYSLKPRIQKLYAAQQQLVSGYLAEAKAKLANKDVGYEEGQGGLALFRAFRGLPKNNSLIKYLSEQGTKVILQKVEGFYMQDNSKNMPKADDPLLFTIDEKNNSIELTDKGIDMLTADGEDPTFFIMPDVGGEIAELEKADMSDEDRIKAKDKLLQDFSIKSERIHSVNQLLKAYTLFEKDVEYIVMDSKVKIVDEQTGRVMDGRRYSDGLHQAIEAKENVKVEKASQTMATITLQNFFRMYHKLSGMTGTAETEAGEFWEIYKLDVVVIPTNRPIVRDDQEDLVYKTKREKYAAVIKQVDELTKQGRPVLVGTTSVDVSELLSRMLTMHKIDHNVLNAKQHSREAQVVAEAGLPGKVTIATNMAGRGTDIKLSDEVKKSGGLAILGTERHDSRRVDRQLRGRAGRQGDAGSSIFYVSLEDELMRLFSSDRIAKVMDKMGFQEGEVIQHSMITKSIERAQKKVEENNFGIRKRLLEYDDVMNAQREVVYKRRQHALIGERLSVDLDNTFYDLAKELIDIHREEEDYDSYKLDMIRYFSVESKITKDDFATMEEESILNEVVSEIRNQYHRKCNNIIEIAMPHLQGWYESKSETIDNIYVPFTDGQKKTMVTTPLKESYESGGKVLIKSFEKNITLSIMDMTWKEHLREMDSLKQGVQMASYEQKDPLLIYKLEAFKLFKEMLSGVNKDLTSFLFKASIPIKKDEEVKEAREQRRENNRYQESRNEAGGGGSQNGKREQKKVQPVRVAKKVGRNEPCPCGSGKKYKQCHGKVAQDVA